MNWLDVLYIEPEYTRTNVIISECYVLHDICEIHNEEPDKST